MLFVRSYSQVYSLSFRRVVELPSQPLLMEVPLRPHSVPARRPGRLSFREKNPEKLSEYSEQPVVALSFLKL